jgi:spermidine synthase
MKRQHFLIGLGLFLTTSSLLMLEISLTRIFSVIMWYHFAFFTISVAMFGLATSGLVVFSFPKFFTKERALWQTYAAVVAFAVAVPACFALFTANPAQVFVTGFLEKAKAGGFLSVIAVLELAALYLSAVIPFFICGLVIAILLRHYGHMAGQLYFWDLAGAGIGCIATILVLDIFGGPGSMWAVAVLAALAAATFAASIPSGERRVAALLLAALFGGLLFTNSIFGWLQIHYTRSPADREIVQERWNSFSRVSVERFESQDSLLIAIDAASNTMISGWNGDAAELEKYRYGLIATQYAVMDQPSVLIIGSGGGIDILTALSWRARAIQAIEVNPIIVDLMMNDYADFSGRIYHAPNLSVAADEARSWIRRTPKRFDIIQAGYVDTYAATASGAFTLTENTLYTVEAYQDYLDHLTPDGIMSMQRYYEEQPQQGIRLVSLALEALRLRGDDDPSAHIAVLRKGERASVLLKNSPFSEPDVLALEEFSEKGGIELVAAPGRPGKGLYGELLRAENPREVIDSYPYDISAVGDDRPFFFYVVKPTQFWEGLLLRSGEAMNSRAVFILTSLLIVVALLSVVVLLLPAWFGRHRISSDALPAMLYFAALGLGFMLVEIGLLQRLMLFLGHPTLALSVVLSVLLVSAGLGSGWTRTIPLEKTGSYLGALILLVIGIILLVSFMWPPLLRAWIGLERPLRILVSIATIFPVGFLLGTAFPLGIRRLAAGRGPLIPWAWSVNGMCSVFGSVLAMVVAINSGFTATLLAGAVCYVFALLLIRKTEPQTVA